MFFVVCWCFSNSTFQKFFQEYHASVKQFGSRSGSTLCRAWSGSKLFAKAISRRHFLKLLYFSCPWTLAACVRISSSSCLHNKNTLFFKLPTLLTPSKAAYMVSGEGALSSVGREEEVICFSLTSWRMFARKVTKRKITFSSVTLILRRSNNFSGAWKR